MTSVELILVRKLIDDLNELAEASSRAIKSGQGMLIAMQREIERQQDLFDASEKLRLQGWHRGW